MHEPQISPPDRRWAKTLTHPTRIAILLQLLNGQASPTELATTLGQSLGTVSYHVRCLLAAGQIRLVSEAMRRGAVAHTYSLTDPAAAADALERIGLAGQQTASSDPRSAIRDPSKPGTS